MPELPDVEGYRRHFNRYAAGKRVQGVRVPSPDIVRNATPRRLERVLRGRTLRRARRHGKWMLAPFGEATLLLHFGMTGRLVWRGDRDAEGPHRHDRLILRLGDGALAYRNMRKLGGVWLALDDEEVGKVTGPLGPDASELDEDGLGELLTGRRGGLKATLMNQRVVAGIGNELSDELLWQARLDPRRRGSELKPRELSTLARTLGRVLADSNRHGRIPRHPAWISSQRGDRKPTCPRCRRGLRRETIAGRTAYWCPRCQR
jgi:formamidopyrimidine-DNA glycosylase